MSSLALVIAIAVEVSWALMLLCLYGFWWAQRKKCRRDEKAALAIRPVIRDALSIYVAGGNNLRDLQQLSRSNRPEFERSIMAFQAVAGSTNCERMGELALELTLVHDWLDDAQSQNTRKRRQAFSRLCSVAQSEPVMRISRDLLERGLKDRDEFVRLMAARSLARSSEIGDTSKAFRAALAESRRFQLLVSHELRHAALGLCSAATELLQSADTNLIIKVLDVLASWRCALPLENVEHLIESPNPAVRLKTLQLLPRLPVTPQNRSAILRALSDLDSEVRAAATDATEILKVQVPNCSYGSETALTRASLDLNRRPEWPLEEEQGTPSAMLASSDKDASGKTGEISS